MNPRSLNDNDIRRCASCGCWVLIGRPCHTCSLHLQAQCVEGTRQALAHRARAQEVTRIRERRAVLETLYAKPY